MKHLGQLVALICGQTVICAWVLTAIRLCEKNSFPKIIVGTLFIGAIAGGIWCAYKLLALAQQTESYEKDLSYANHSAKHWFAKYEQARQELEYVSNNLQCTEEELFDLQQAHSELGEAYNELRDLLMENGIDPDIPRF